MSKIIITIILLFSFYNIGYAELSWTNIPCEEEFKKGLIPAENYPQDNEICGSPEYTIIDTTDMNKAYSIILNEVLCPEEATKYDYCQATPKVLPKSDKRIKFADYCSDNEGGICYVTFKYSSKDSFDLSYTSACFEGTQDEYRFEKINNKIKVTKWYFPC